MKRKIYSKLLEWKNKRHGETAVLIEGARRIGKSYIVEDTTALKRFTIWKHNNKAPNALKRLDKPS